MKRFTTIVVTIHNRERYLRQCLDSIIKQTERDIEIICVDDASTDSCPDILHEYEQKDGRIRLCLLEKNVGVQCARNIAMDMAKGEYIIYVDDDDWLSEDCVEHCMESFEQYPDADCVLIPEKRVNTDGTMYDPADRIHFDCITGEEAFMLSMPWRIAGNFCVSTQYQRKHRFDNTCRYFGDENTGRLMLLSAKKVVLSKGMYYYRMNEDSVCHTVGIGQYSRLQAQRKLANELYDRGEKKDIRAAYETFCWQNVVGAYMRYYIERKKMTKDLRQKALALIKQGWRGMNFCLVNKSLKNKFGFMPIHSHWIFFRIQEELYFTLRTMLGRMNLDMDGE